jgi:hypothetical protein
MSTNDWETLKGSRDMSASTERSYMAAYKRLSSGLERSISETGQRTLIKLLPTAALNPNSQASLLNIAIVVKHACGKPTDELVAHREVVQARIAIYKKSRNRIKSETLPTLKELEANADADLAAGKALHYVTQKLLLELGCRCMDLNLLVVYDRHLIGTTDNYLLVRSRDLVVVRNVYKTAEAFGPKRHVLTSRPLYKAVCTLSRYSEEPLLMNTNGERCHKDGLSKFISRHTLNGLGEGDYFKIMVKAAAARDSGGWQALAKLSDRRGTAIETIVSEYDLSLQ